MLPLFVHANKINIRIRFQRKEKMELQSVRKTAERFNISERRVQKLCEDGRIVGAQMISNVWLIPSTSEKPSDERTSISDSELMSLSDLCKELSISVATGRNWLKLGKLNASSTVKNSALFSHEYVSELKNNIQSGRNSFLKSRRNKKYLSGNNVYNSYVSDESQNKDTVQRIVSFCENNNIELTDDILCAVIAECAVQLIIGAQGQDNGTNSLLKYLKKDLPASNYWFLIDDLIGAYPNLEHTIMMHTQLFEFRFVYEHTEDVLGLLYISLNNIRNRKASGSYYTPTKVVKKLCAELFSMNNPEGKDIIDPCCGTGNFILQLPPEIGYEHIFGNDIDPICVKIARLNYALKYGVSNQDTIYSHITENDFLLYETDKQYDFIIGNPPWGYEYTESQKTALREKYSVAIGNSIESYDVFVEQALSVLREGGLLSFVLPEAFLNVKTHTSIRKKLLKCCHFQYIEYLGNVFDKVQCPCIILQVIVTNTVFNSIGIKISDGTREYVINTERVINEECISFTTTDEEYRVLKKMENLKQQTTLLGKARFALGIVTGNNKKYLSSEKTPYNEMVLKGSDLKKFKFTSSSNYLVFKPESFQQIAPIQYYRAPEKLLYRFICNQLVFAYDNEQTLSLNSCNILIPEIPTLDMKYILAILNSRCAQFYFRKVFNSVKVLRSHIERIPLPVIKKSVQDKIITIVDSIIETSDAALVEGLYERLDTIIASLYELSPEEYGLVKASMQGESLFL